MLYSFDLQHRTGPAVPSGEPTDEQLMTRIQRRDESALALLARRHHALLRTIIGRMISNDHDADEIEDECLLEVWRHAGSYSVEKGHALGWLVTLVRRRTIDRIRRKTAYSRAQDRYRDATTSVAATHCGADEEAARSDTAGIVAQLIENLPPKQQQAIRLAYFRGLSQRQIAAHIGIPLGTIKTRLELALRKLRSSALAFGGLRDTLEPARAC